MPIWLQIILLVLWTLLILYLLFKAITSDNDGFTGSDGTHS